MSSVLRERRRSVEPGPSPESHTDLLLLPPAPGLPLPGEHGSEDHLQQNWTSAAGVSATEPHRQLPLPAWCWRWPGTPRSPVTAQTPSPVPVSAGRYLYLPARAAGRAGVDSGHREATHGSTGAHRLTDLPRTSPPLRPAGQSERPHAPAPPRQPIGSVSRRPPGQWRHRRENSFFPSERPRLPGVHRAPSCCNVIALPAHQVSPATPPQLPMGAERSRPRLRPRHVRRPHLPGCQ